MEKKLFKNKKITIMGLGLHGGGVGVAKFFVKQGAKVLVTDLKTKGQLKESLKKLRQLPIKYILGKHKEEDFINTDLVIKNPAVPNDSIYLKISQKHRVPTDTDIGIFFELCKAPVIGVTGTKGKSTTATIIYRLLKSNYPNVILAGNIGASALESLPKIKKDSIVVLELSSWQLEGLARHEKSPKISVITNIYPDHLNRYRNLTDYIKAKKIIFKYQRKNDTLLLNYDNLNARKLSVSALSKVYFFSTESNPKINKKIICYLKNKEIYFKQEPVFNVEELKLYGEHNLSNVLAAISVARFLKVPSKNIKRVLKSIRGIPWRQELVAEIRGVKYFNDTTATMPDAAIAAIKTLAERFPRANIVLICGGEDKKLNYNGLTKEIIRKAISVVFLPGSASKKIKRGLIGKKIVVQNSDSMRTAVNKAAKLARKGDIVLLSPAAASFNLFKNEFDRGEQYNKNVKSLMLNEQN